MCAIGMRRRFDDALDNLATNRFVAPLTCLRHYISAAQGAHGALVRSCGAVGGCRELHQPLAPMLLTVVVRCCGVPVFFAHLAIAQASW